MKQMFKSKFVTAIFGSVSISIVAGLAIRFLLVPAPVKAACATLPTDKGVVTQTVNVSTTGTYKVWSRIMAPDTTNNSYYLEIDDTTCGVNVGDTAIAANAWTWGDYKDGNTASKISVTLSAGSHTFRFVGKEPGVKLDRVLLLSDTCVPTGTGDNCATSGSDATPPAVSVTAPTAGQTVSGTITVSANATDNVGVAGVQFKLDGANLGAEDTAGPFSVSWNTTTAANGAHSLTAVARDAAGNITTSSAVSVTVSNTTTTNQADLVVTAITWTPANPSTGQPVTFSATIKNQGTAASSESPGVQFQVDGGVVTWVTFAASPTIPAGGSVTLTANGGINGNTWAATTGSHTIQAHVDDLGRIAESNDNNNILTANLTVGTTTTKTGDLNGDNSVNIFDLSILLSNYSTNNANADINKDGTVNIFDLSILLSNYGK